MSNLSKFKFKCIRCGACCTDGNTIVNLTHTDILRLSKGLKLTLDELLEVIGFYIYEKKITESDISKMVITPIMTERGLSFPGLKKNPEGICYFYNTNENKCRIYKIRPNFCRTFPFTFEFGERKNADNQRLVNINITNKGIEYCPGLDNKYPEIDFENWIDLGKSVLEDLGDNEKFIRSWFEKLKKTKTKPKAKGYLNEILNS
ncbi:MAG: YkgJ family cysteine cluster protein [Promethearchaeota archaeon]